MANYYITATGKGSPYDEYEIIRYKYTNMKGLSTGQVVTKQAFGSMVDKVNDRFYSNNIQLGTCIECKWFQRNGGIPFLKSDSDGTTKDNLLKLPDC